MTISSGNRSKRTRDDRKTPPSRRSVVITPRDSDQQVHNRVEACKQRLATIIAYNENSTSFKANIANINNLRKKGLEEIVDVKRNEGKELSEKMNAELQMTENKVKEESSSIAALQHDLECVEQAGKDLDAEINTVSVEVDRLEQENAAMEKSIKNDEEKLAQSRNRNDFQVNRLQQQLSLFGTSTGIKWDFEAQEQDENYLVGQVDIPSLETIRGFKIDCVENSDFEVADMLWDMIGGEPM